jgi:coenzyme F420-0:L-glutamate ligase/coenzyme F420-1:gamma-L-glutamate ligase
MSPKISKSSKFPEIKIFGIRGLPEISPGDNLPKILYDIFVLSEFDLMEGDILIVSQKIISKAEGALVDLKHITPSEFARNLSRKVKKDPRHVEVILRESKRIVRMDRDIMICETKHGFVCANAGVDKSNIPGKNWVSLLPSDPDKSAKRIRMALKKYSKIDISVVIVDTFGRPWREGLTNVAIGVSGINPLRDLCGKRDTFSYILRKTKIAVIDELASAAELVMGKTKKIPAAIVRGFSCEKNDSGIKSLLRLPERDLFR